MRSAASLLGPADSARLRRMVAPVDPDRVDVRPLPRWVPVPHWVGAVTTPWAIYVRPHLLEGDRPHLARLLAHELVHARQWQTWGTVPFLVYYLGDYVRGRRRGLDHGAAYQAIRLEAEAAADSDRLAASR